jgi:hypothetical protein
MRIASQLPIATAGGARTWTPPSPDPGIVRRRAAAVFQRLAVTR